MNPEQARSDLALAKRSYARAAFTSLPVWTQLTSGAIVGGGAGWAIVIPAGIWARFAWFCGSFALALAVLGLGAWLRHRQGLRGTWRTLRALLAEISIVGAGAWILELDPASPYRWAVFVLCLATALLVRLALLRDASGDWSASLRACWGWCSPTRRRP